MLHKHPSYEKHLPAIDAAAANAAKPLLKIKRAVPVSIEPNENVPATKLVAGHGQALGIDLIANDAQLSTKAEALVAAAEAGDMGAPFKPEALELLRSFKTQDLAGWMQLRKRLKKADVGITELERHLQNRDGAAAPQEVESVADKLIGLARSRCEFMHDAQREPYAVFEADGARQVHGVSSKGFSEFLSHAYYAEHDRAPTESSLMVALATLRGQAQFDGASCEVFTRVAKTPEGYWLDLCNDAWQCVQITATGWAVVAGTGTPFFTRSSSMRPLPVPLTGGTLNDLWKLANVLENDQPMLLVWLLECLRSDTPFVVLELAGEQGSAKSWTQKVLRRLIDPNQADLRAAPKVVEDVWVAAKNSHMVSLENLSHLSPAYQDALCVLATGGGYSGRTLYTNLEETIHDLCKPIVLNGIAVIVTQQDLLDRCLHIELPTITTRELASVLEERFMAAQPKLLGALLDLFAQVLATLPGIEIAPERLPRMADFAVMGEALFQVRGEEEGAFLERYSAMRKEGVHRTIDASPVGAALLAFMEATRSEWNGQMVNLLERLEPYRPHGDAWPRTGKGLGDVLRRLAPALRLIGIECKSDSKKGGNVIWSIFFRTESFKPSPASPDSSAEKADFGPSAGHAGHGLNSSHAEKKVSPTDLDGDCEVF